MFRQHFVAVVAIVLLLASIGLQIFIKHPNRVGCPMVTEDLKENVEYLAVSPMVTSLTELEKLEGIQNVLITELGPMDELLWLKLSEKKVNKADFNNLTYGSKIIRKGQEIRIVAPPTLMPAIPEKKDKNKDKDT